MPSDLPLSTRAPAAKRARIFLRSVLLAAVAALTAAAAMRLVQARAGPSAEAFVSSGRAAELPRLWRLPDVDVVDHRRASFALRGATPFIADFIFTQCTSACPLLTARLVQLQRRLPSSTLRFLSVSVDPAHDDAEALRAYAERFRPDERRWSLVPTTQTSLDALAEAFRVAVASTGAVENPILHSELFFLVDGEGFVRGVYPSTDGAALERLVRDAQPLLGGASSESLRPQASASYETLGCAGCHERAAVGPPLLDLAGASRPLEGGGEVVVDEAYLRRALLEPGAELVRGYLPLMPSYGEVLTDAEIAALVQELLARRSDAPRAQDEAIAVVTDPVCHMRVRAEPDAPRARHAGSEVFFCSEVCREQFLAAPKRYPLAP